MKPEMNSKNQKEAFLAGEGDQYFKRNKVKEDYLNNLSEEYSDPLIPFISKLPLESGSKINVLEVGCGRALRLKQLHANKGWSVHGVDPSEQAVKYAQKNGINSKIATADKLPYEENKFDILIFGFCLYVCDREDLFKIAAEANRVLKEESWLAIFDFWSPFHKENEYKHLEGLKSYKMDLTKMFKWHPSYNIFDHSVKHHTKNENTDNSKEWVAVTILRKKSIF